MNSETGSLLFGTYNFLLKRIIMINKVFLSLLFLCLAIATNAQRSIPLYTGRIPDSKQVPNEEKITPNSLVDTIATDVSIPTLTVFLPPDSLALGTAVIICPGGGYHALLINREEAKWQKLLMKLVLLQLY